MVASSFELRAWSACSASALRRAGVCSSTCSSTPSSEPYFWISCDAVLSPIPGTPAMLSEVSPFSPMKSGTWSGGDPEPRLDPLGRVDVHVGDAARGHHQADVVGDELERVAVGRDDARLDPGLVGARREGGDHVVRLPALELEVPVAERLDDRAEERELLAQEIRHRPAALLVVGGELRAVNGARVPGDGDALRPVVREQLEEHVREAEERAGGEAVARRQLLRQREERAVGEVVPVDEEELGVARRGVVELELFPAQRLRRHDCDAIVRA